MRTKLSGAPLSPTDELGIADELAQHLEDRFHQLLGEGLPETQAVVESQRELDADDFVGDLMRGLKDES